jgi:hypothetical protein
MTTMMVGAGVAYAGDDNDPHQTLLYVSDVTSRF